MILNGRALFEAAPIKDMLTTKVRHNGVSHGLAEAGYDIRIKQDVHFKTFAGEMTATTNDKDLGWGTGHGRFVIASALEEFQMPNHVVGMVADKSTWARQGLSVFNTVIEPGWNGFLTLELVYHGSKDLKISAGSGIAQVLFSVLYEEGDYGVNGKYQNQANRPVEAIS